MLIVRKYDSKRKVTEEGGGGGGIFDQLKLGLAMIPLRLGFDTYNKIMKHGESGNLVHKMYSSKTGEHKRLDFVCTKPGEKECSEKGAFVDMYERSVLVSALLHLFLKHRFGSS